MMIRKANVEDIPQITLIKKRENYQKYLKRVVETAEGLACYIVIEEDGEILGNVFLKYYGTQRDPGFPNIEDLFIRDDKRNIGLGTKLLKECERLAKERGFEKIGLSVNKKNNPKAYSLYERLGYKDVEREEHLSGIYDGVEDWCIDMAKNI